MQRFARFMAVLVAAVIVFAPARGAVESTPSPAILRASDEDSRASAVAIAPR